MFNFVWVPIMGRHKKEIKETVKEKPKSHKLCGEDIDRFNTLLSKTMKDCACGKEFHTVELIQSLSDIDSELFEEELKWLENPTDEILDIVDKSVTEKVKLRGRE